MPAIDVLADNIHGYVYIEVDWSDQVLVTQARVIRVNLVDGTETTVRVNTSSTDGQCFLLATGVGYVYDTEAPLDVPLYYRTEACANSTLTATSSEVTVDSSNGLWLKDPLRPFNDRRLILQSDGTECIPGRALYFGGLTDESYANRTDLPVVINRRNPIPSSSVRGGMASQLGIVARTFIDRDALKDTLAPGTPLFLQGPVKYGFDDMYLAVGDVTIGRMSIDMKRQWRRFDLPFTEVDRPAGLATGVLGARWRDMCDVYPTFGDATAAGVDWQFVMQGGAGTAGEGVITSLATWTSVVGHYATWTDVTTARATWTLLVEEG